MKDTPKPQRLRSLGDALAFVDAELRLGRPPVCIGDDTPTGEPENGPKGPYITEEDDGTRSPHPGRVKEAENRRKAPEKRPLPSRTETAITKKSELGSDRSGS